jgi:hypothetical protein
MIETVCEYYNLSPTRNREPGRRGQHTGSGCDVLRQALAHFGVHKAYSTIESDHRWVKQNRLQDLLHPQHMQALHELADRRFDVEAFELCCLKLIGRHG